MDNIVKKLFFALLQYAGIIRIWQWKNRHKLLVVVVHGVMVHGNATKDPPLRWQLDSGRLREYLQLLTKRYNFVSAKEATTDQCDGIGRQAYHAIFTIDDGYRNALTHAWPILREFHIKPVVFVATDMIGSDKPYWFDQLDECVLALAYDGEVVQIGQAEIPIDRHSHKSLERSCREIIYASRTEFPDEAQREKAIADLIREFETRRSTIKTESSARKGWTDLMSAEDIKDCVAEGIVIGSHTKSHVRIPFVSDERLQDEVCESKRILEEITETPCEFFCYPEGSYDDRSARFVENAGYVAAFSSEAKLTSLRHSRFRLGRYHLPREASDAELLAIMSGLKAFIVGVKKQLSKLVRGAGT